MALFNEIQVGRVNRFVQKLLAIKGGPPVPTVSSDLQLGFHLHGGPETLWLEGWDCFGFSATVATAASTGAARLRNPAGSNVVAVIESVLIQSGTSGVLFNFEMGATGTSLATVGSGVVMDSRGRTGATCVPSSGTTAPLSGVGRARPLANTPFQFVTPLTAIPVLPGQAFHVDTPNNSTTNLDFTFMWRERFLEDSERQ